ncbi:tRNA modification GTPase GTPBP3, mitochondrial-like [Photinus pyralis]|uniref:tRNA modification GTPase GTPBP3, mitochondrial-like n=1 Tax=Photinus pyralis TaxID=7054 RepID=UPI00126768CB|nr:tRNA modification GTPase GTPBP3, mitochondrial-like [Photinus pyralis]
MRWKNVLVSALANLEAYIDFHETEVLDADLVNGTMNSVLKLSEDIRKHLGNGVRGECLRNGVKTVLIGETNVGKSSLANVLCSRPLSIVTPIHGTTRDVLEATLDIGGYPVVLNDTAGLRSQSADVIEQEGMIRTLRACEDANLILLVADCTNYLSWQKASQSSNFLDFLAFYARKLDICDILFNEDNTTKKPFIVIGNKVDLVEECDLVHLQSFQNLISCNSKKGIDFLTSSIIDQLKQICGEPTEEHPSMNQVRHREYLTLCLRHLESYLQDRQSFDDNTVFMAEKLRKALRQLDKLTGTFSTEQLLSVIFNQFCIGK